MKKHWKGNIKQALNVAWANGKKQRWLKEVKRCQRYAVYLEKQKGQDNCNVQEQWWTTRQRIKKRHTNK